ncbi:MAG: hypothetical protein II537_02735 [Bacteroidales bacterium]|nr:hypothetical protein [Bacteroidales bacterium]
MHTALWMFCWPASPAAANEVFLMQFTGPRVDTVRHRCRFIRNSVLSERVVKTMKSLQLGQSKRLTYNGNVSYALTDKEHKAAMAINPCVISREIDRKTGKECFFIRLDNTWPLHSQTHIGLWKGAEIVVQEGLFRYIQDKGLIHHFVDEYCYPVKEIL